MKNPVTDDFLAVMGEADTYADARLRAKEGAPVKAKRSSRGMARAGGPLAVAAGVIPASEPLAGVVASQGPEIKELP